MLRRLTFALAGFALCWTVVAQAGPPASGKSRVVRVQPQEDIADDQVEEASAVEEQPTAPEPTPDNSTGGAGSYDGGGEEIAPGMFTDDGVIRRSCGRGCRSGCCDLFANGPPRGFWGRAEYIDWWLRGDSLPPLVTTSPTGTLPINAGILPAATILYGNERVNGDPRSGARATFGYWFDDCQGHGVEATVFGLNQGASTFSAASDSNGSPILARPFFNTLTQAQDAGLVAYPGILAGSIGVNTTSQLFGVDVNVRRAVVMNRCVRWDILAGYRFFRLDENLQVHENDTSIDPNGRPVLGTMFDVTDKFGAHNMFNGGQIGAMMTYHRRRLTLEFSGKLAIGDMIQQANISGQTITTVPGFDPVTQAGGFLALASNSGHFTRNQFSLLPELDINLRYQLTRIWKANVGYTLIGVTNVARPGGLIDLNIDPSQFPPPIAAGTQPAFAFHNSDLILQGVNVGMECNF